MAKKKPTDNPNPSKTLRERAEELLNTSYADIAGMSNEDVRKLVHELQVHQIELEIQNEDLREAQIELSHSRDRYSDLYEFAPVGYLTLDRQGVIQEANLTAATMLGVERNRLANRKLTDFLSDDAKDAWHLHRREVFSDEAKKSCELAPNPAHGNPLTVRLESLAFRDEDGNLSECRTALIDVTIVRQARQQLEESEQRYHRLTDAVTDYVYHVRVENGVAVETTHGPNCVAVTGYAPEEFTANPMLWITMVPPEDRVLVEQQAVDILAKPYVRPVEHRIQRKDGQIRWVLETVSPQHDDHGNLVAFDGLVRDITVRKEAEEALHQLNEELELRVDARTAELQAAEQRLRFVLDTSPAVLFTCETSGTFDATYVSETIRDLTGFHPREFTETPEFWDEHIHPDDKLGLESDLKQLFEHGHRYHEYRFLRSDGSYLWVHEKLRLVRDDTGQPKEIVGCFVDITERKRAEQGLREREERLRSVLDTASDAIITMDQRGIITGINPATGQMFGYTAAELIGQNVKILMPAPYCDEHDGYIARYLETGEARIIGIGREVVGKRKDGSTFPVDLAVSQIDHMGLFTGVIRDISERKKLQRDVLGIAEAEQRRIGQELHDGSQQELVGLGMLAQTLRDNLSKDSDDPPRAGAPDACELATKIVNGIARLHREVQTISRGLVPVNFDVRGLADALRQLASRTDDLEGVTCAFKCEQQVELADNSTATHLYRIAQEAIANALKHGQPEHILIALESDNCCPVLLIADDGSGFESTKEYEGIGLKTMLYRASLIGAALTVSPVEAGGTLVACKVYGGGSLR